MDRARGSHRDPPGCGRARGTRPYGVARRAHVAQPPLLVAVDGVTDPQNLGAILRTAEVAGATGAVLPRHRGALLAPAAVKAAAGAVEHLPIVLVGGIVARSSSWRAPRCGASASMPTARHRSAPSSSRTHRSCSCSARRVVVCRVSSASAATCSPPSRCTGSSSRSTSRPRPQWRASRSRRAATCSLAPTPG